MTVFRVAYPIADLQLKKILRILIFHLELQNKKRVMNDITHGGFCELLEINFAMSAIFLGLSPYYKVFDFSRTNS